ncbi:mitochondrial RNA binding protein [Strigomonas culicis]|uniref:Mitochondrial RNA binding protein n=2 Tax=Strigomonas culicis TaxID=28005 RepID=S9VMJ5_9TRYP|nr:mitochondrial RNA binding protein [Strigomonas culicis]|eukprot:EPY28366.1 mitochondrial RNA binding protein [Strigomonas culicis]
MFRRLGSCASAAAVVATGAARSIAVFSQQHHILEGNQKARGSPSNVWVEDWEVDRLGFKPEEGALPTQLVLDKQLELYNFDQLLSPPEVMEAPRHSSYSSRKVYGEKLQFELNDRAQKQGFQSKWWITRSQAYKEDLQFKGNPRASIILTKSQLKLFHSSQLQGGDALMTYPISGGSRKLYYRKGEPYRLIKEHIKMNQFNSGLYFTRRQLEFFKLAVQQGQSPLLQDIASGERYLLYNVDQLEDPQVALKTLQRAPVNVPTFLLTGEQIQHESAKKFPKSFKSNYWLTGRDAELYQWPIKDSEKRKGVTFNSNGAASLQLELYNVEQLANPEEAFAKAGLFVQ